LYIVFSLQYCVSFISFSIQSRSLLCLSCDLKGFHKLTNSRKVWNHVGKFGVHLSKYGSLKLVFFFNCGLHGKINIDHVLLCNPFVSSKVGETIVLEYMLWLNSCSLILQLYHVRQSLVVLEPFEEYCMLALSCKPWHNNLDCVGTLTPHNKTSHRFQPSWWNLSLSLSLVLE